MAKQGMARPEWTHPKPHNAVPPVPEIQGKEKTKNSVEDSPVRSGGPGLPSL